MATTPLTSSSTPARAVIFHGYGATPTDHWFGWLAEQLESSFISTTIPALPQPLNPQAMQWEDSVKTALGVPNEQTIVIAHSLGCLAVLRYLRSISTAWRLGALILVSGFVDRLPALPELNDFIGSDFELSGLTEHIDRVLVFRSDNDAIVPPALTDSLAKQLGVSSQVIPGAGHFLAAEGISELPAVFEAIDT